VGFLDRIFGRTRRADNPPAPTRDDTLTSTYVPPPTPEVEQPDDRGEGQDRDDADQVDPSSQEIQVDDSSATDVSDAGGDAGGGGDGGGDGGGGDGGGGGGGD
jgi:hypothetical protein